jgi:hypothetical protein
LFLGLSVAAAAYGGNVGETGGQAVKECASVSEARTTSTPPKLLRAQSIFIQEEDSPYRALSADILVPHVGKTKAVRILGHYRNTGAAFNFKASYSEQAPTHNNELWTVRVPISNVFETDFVPLDLMVEQVIDGVRTVDDNGGKLYVLSALTDPAADAARYVRAKFVLADGCVGLATAFNYFTDVWCGLTLNPAVPRGGKLTMTYTAGRNAQKTETDTCGTAESCYLGVHIPQSTTFKYRLAYVVQGVTYFDDNFGQGYVIDIKHPTHIANGGWTSTGAGRLF